MRDRHIQPAGGSAAREAALARRKLELEIANLESRQALDAQKLALEIGELQAAPARARRTAILGVTTAFLTALTTLTVAGLGGYITWQVQQQADHQRKADSYATLLTNLGSTNVVSRAGAVVGLTPYAVPDSEQSAQTITILVTQLAQESDPTVLRVLMPALVSIGEPALDDVVRANRTAYSDYLTTARAVVIAGMRPFDYYATLPNGSRGQAILDDAALSFTAQIGSLLPPALNARLLLTTNENSIIGVSPEFALLQAAAGNDGTFGLAINSFDALPRLEQPTPANLDVMVRRTLDQARSVFNTGTVLGRLIAAHSNELIKPDLTLVALLSADLRSVSLRGAYFFHSFIAANATAADFTGATFELANLSDTTLAYSNMSYTSLVGALLPTNRDLYNTKWTGADWWDVPAEGFGFIFRGVSGRGYIVEDSIPCPTNEMSEDTLVKPFDLIQTELHGTRFSIVYCGLPDANKAGFEEAFPRAENEKLRADWIARGSPLPTPAAR